MHEMNIPAYIWGWNCCTNTASTSKLVWRAVWNIFRGPTGVGATNVKFLWSVAGPNNVSKLYPGNTYVDYTGLSAFNWARTAEPGHFDTWRSLIQASAPAMKVLLNITTKPIIAAEVGSGQLLTCSTCSKPDWIKNGYPAVRAKWPRIKAIVYMNIDLRHAGHPDWRLTSPPAALDAYKVIVNDIRFKGVIP